MANTYHFDDIFFDAGYYFDDDNNFDSNYDTSIIIESEYFSETQYTAVENPDLIIESDWDIEDSPSKYIDLLRLVPEKFRYSEYLIDLLQDIGLYAGSWLGKIDDLGALIDRDIVPEEYAQQLANLLGLELSVDIDTTEEDRRKQIRQVIDLYKLKGTYSNIPVIAYSLGLTANIYDLYTNDYSTFVKEEWFVGDEGENPAGLDSTYYKSPHFIFEVLLDRKYEVNGLEYLWKESIFTRVYDYAENTRPVHTVPHYDLLLNPVCREDGVVESTAAEILTKTLDSWEISRYYFDMDPFSSSGAGSGSGLFFDDGLFFDWTRESFINQITKWKLGTGNDGVSPDSSGFDLETVVLSGTIDTTTIYDDRVEFEFYVNTGVIQDGISELGLYLDDGTTLTVASTFPDIDKHTEVRLRVLVQIYKE